MLTQIGWIEFQVQSTSKSDSKLENMATGIPSTAGVAPSRTLSSQSTEGMPILTMRKNGPSTHTMVMIILIILMMMASVIPSLTKTNFQRRFSVSSLNYLCFGRDQSVPSGCPWIRPFARSFALWRSLCFNGSVLQGLPIKFWTRRRRRRSYSGDSSEVNLLKTVFIETEGQEHFTHYLHVSWNCHSWVNQNLTLSWTMGRYLEAIIGPDPENDASKIENSFISWFPKASQIRQIKNHR